MPKREFLPSDYTAPESNSNYLKFDKEGDYRFRVVSDAVVGTQLWIDKKPVCKPYGEKFTAKEISRADKTLQGTPGQPTPFMAFAVIFEGAVKILQINQVTIQREIEKLYRDEDYGHPNKYDIVVTRNAGAKVSYTVTPKPPKEMSEDKIELWEEVQKNGFNIDALFTGGNPFGDSSRPVSDEDDEEVQDDVDKELDGDDE